jgi:hypothetical protein
MAINNTYLAELMGSITAESNDAIVEQAYLIVLGREADSEGKDYWVGRLEDGLTAEELLLAVIQGAEFSGETEALTYKNTAAAALIDAGVAADDIAAALIGVTDYASMTDAVNDATGTGSDEDDEGSSFAGIIAASTGGVVEGTEGADTIYLSGAQDFVLAGEGDDSIVARGNSSLDNADIIDGGAGTDTIEVMLDNSETAESPLVMNVEILKVQAQENLTATGVAGENDVDVTSAHNANIDAGDMSSVEEYWSEDSRAAVVIEDVSRNSHITTLGMRETDPGTNVDYEVYFDPENITAPGATESGATLVVKMANVLQIAELGNPVENFASVSFSVDLTSVTVDVSACESYAQVVTAIQDAATEAGLDVDVELQTATNAYFSIDIDTYSAGELAGTYNPILITNNGAGSLVKGSFTFADDATDGAYTNTMATGAAASTPALTQVDVVFDRVGKDSKGGDFLAGSDSTGAYSGSAGIQQFNVEVDRDSWLNSVSSTNNTLEVVNVENIEEYSDGNGSLRIDALTDVRVFDAASMTGDVTLTATLSAATTGKYLDLTDDEANPASDNSESTWLDVIDREFSYDMGTGDDTLNLTISNSNLAAAGTTNREDFELEIQGNNGNDTITTIIQLGAGTGATAEWYVNSKENANLEISAGNGNDTVTTTGAGDFIIDLGAGNDTVYADNIGGKATMVVGATPVAAAINLDDLLSQANANYFLVDGQVRITIDDIVGTNNAAAGVSGFEVYADIPTGDNYTVTNLHINQAIKDAINNSAIASKLYAVSDGPANTLIIQSLIDGTIANTNLDIEIMTPNYATYTAAEQTSVATAYQKFVSDSTQTWAAAIAVSEANADVGSAVAAAAANTISTAINGIGAGTAVEATAGATYGWSAGTVSAAESDNTITGNTGDDVLILGTGARSNDTVEFSSSFGYDYVVNFTDTAAALDSDTIDVTDYLGNLEDIPGSGSETSKTTIATTSDFTGVAAYTVADGNEVIVINDFIGDAGADATAGTADDEEFANLTAAKLLAAIEDTADNTDNFGNIANTSLDMVMGNANFVGTTVKTVVMVENDNNQGEYKVFEVTSSTTTSEFTAATLVGTVDFGESLAATTQFA